MAQYGLETEVTTHLKGMQMADNEQNGGGDDDGFHWVKSKVLAVKNLWFQNSEYWNTRVVYGELTNNERPLFFAVINPKFKRLHNNIQGTTEVLGNLSYHYSDNYITGVCVHDLYIGNLKQRDKAFYLFIADTDERVSEYILGKGGGNILGECSHTESTKTPYIDMMFMLDLYKDAY